MSDAAINERQEEPQQARRKPVVVKLRQKQSDGPRLVGCPAYPATGLLAGASVEWCRKNRGAMTTCAACPWRNT